MNALLEARPSTAAPKSRLSVLTTFDSPGSNTVTPQTYTLSSSTPADSVASTGWLDAGNSMQQLARPATPGPTSRSSYAIVSSKLLAASSPHTPASPQPTRTARCGLLNSPASSSTPTAAQVLGASEGSFNRLLSGKVSRARTSVLATQPVGLGTAGTSAAAPEVTGTVPVPSRSSTIPLADRAPPGAAAAASRVSLAVVGLLAAPDAALLPGSPLGNAAAGVAATWFGSSNNNSNSSSGAGRSSISGRSQGLAAAFLQVAPVPQPGSSSKPAAPAASAAHIYIPRPQESQAAAEQSSATDASRSSSRAQGKQTGSASFRTTSRDKVQRVGRVAAPAADAPGPAHYRPRHGPTDKHVPAAHLVTASSSRPTLPGTSATAAAQEQQQPGPEQHIAQQHRPSTDFPTAAAAAGALTVLATRGSATGTPRSDEVLPSRCHGPPVLPCQSAAAQQHSGLARTTGAASCPSATLGRMCQLATPASTQQVAPWHLTSTAADLAAAQLEQQQMRLVAELCWQGQQQQQQTGQGCGAGQQLLTGARTRLATSQADSHALQQKQSSGRRGLRRCSSSSSSSRTILCSGISDLHHVMRWRTCGGSSQLT
ncbi:hypothetical protein COO60DRAFT_1023884 [Scenedesmus sp. NREL 46B-D3]|nr:hypothetical protein COO60DRAFT_1023884 [Scenedesmus sp. NREL 46B-D3]